MNAYSPLSLMNLQVSTLFVVDAAGQLRYTREPGYAEAELDPAPRFWMGRTHEGNIWRFRHDLSDDLKRELEHVCRAEPVAVNLADSPMHADAIRTLLHTATPITHEERGPAYFIPDTVQAPANGTLVSDANAFVLEAHFPWKITSPSGVRTGLLMAVVVGDSAVSICYCARLTDQAAEAGVETVANARGQGYASAAVAAWAGVVRQRGLIPLYSTSWENVASQGVARKLGLIHYGEDWSII